MNDATHHSPLGTIAAWWGLVGTVGLLVKVVIGLFPLAAGILEHKLGPLHWALVIMNVVFMAYSEGYRGFQKSFSPRVAARCVELRSQPTFIRTVFAPLYVIGFFSAPRRILLTVWGITFGVFLLVQLVRVLEQPWRGIVDAGVVAGLAWGAAATLALGVRALNAGNETAAPSTAPVGEQAG
jgi:hypothetical protein